MRPARLAPLVLALLAGGAMAQDPFDPARWPYTAIGKLNVVRGANRTGFCTATLIGPRLVLTAAHCLWDAPRGRFVHPSSVHFVAGWAQGRYGAHAVASAFRTDPAYVYGTGPASLAADWALLELAEAVPIEPVPLAKADAAPSGEVRRAGYSRERAQVMSAQGGCTARLAGALLLHDCRAVPGQSGSALLLDEAGRPAVAGVLVAGRAGEGTATPSLAVPTATFREAARAMLGGPPPR